MNRSDLKQLAEHHGVRFVAGAVDCDEPTLLTFIEHLLEGNHLDCAPPFREGIPTSPNLAVPHLNADRTYRFSMG